MRQLPILLLASLLLPAQVHSQSLPSAPEPAKTASTDDQDWDRLTFVAGDTKVFVKSKTGTTRCENLRIDDQNLWCEPNTLFGSARASRIPRSEVLRVRERLGDGDSGIAIVAAVAGGFVWGHSWDRPAQHGLDGIVVGTAFGFAAWKLTPAVLHFLPGKTVYRRQVSVPDDQSK